MCVKENINNKKRKKIMNTVKEFSEKTIGIFNMGNRNLRIIFIRGYYIQENEIDTYKPITQYVDRKGSTIDGSLIGIIERPRLKELTYAQFLEAIMVGNENAKVIGLSDTNIKVDRKIQLADKDKFFIFDIERFIKQELDITIGFRKLEGYTLGGNKRKVVVSLEKDCILVKSENYTEDAIFFRVPKECYSMIPAVMKQHLQDLYEKDCSELFYYSINSNNSEDKELKAKCEVLVDQMNMESGN